MSGWFPLGIATGWNALKIGNGGLINRIDIAPDGTMVAGTDSFGAYIWNVTQDQWVPLQTNIAIPTLAIADVGGCQEIKIDSSNSNNIWMMIFGKIYKSTNKGNSFTTTSFSVLNPLLSGNERLYGPYIAIDPNNSSIVYISTTSRGLYKTIDGGSTFSQVTAVSAGLPTYINNTASPPNVGTDSTSLTIGTGSKAFNNNSASFGFAVGAGNFVQVWETSNPANQMIGNVTASSGTTFTINVTNAVGSGTHSDWTVSQLNAIGAGHRICFDISGGTAAGKTNNIFVHTYGIGTYRSTDGGASWTLLNTAGAPNAIRRMACDPFGVLWVVDDMYSNLVANLDKWDSSTWSNVAPGVAGGTFIYNSVAVDVLNSAAKATTHVAFVGGDKFWSSFSQDGGATWHNAGGDTSGNRTYTTPSNDVQWLQSVFTANPTGFFANTDAAFDPTHSGRLYTGSEGAWYFTPPTAGTVVAFTQQTRGVEEFIGIQIVSPNGAGNSVIMTAWDYPMFNSSNFNIYPTTVSGAAGPGQAGLLRGYSVDWLWNTPATIVSIIQDGTGNSPVLTAVEQSGISTNGGATWTKFATPASTTNGGDIAIADATHFVWISTDTGSNVPQITTNGGTTWANISIAGGTPTAGWGRFANFATSSKTMDSDKGNGDIYIYNVNTGAGSDNFYKYTQATGLWSAKMHPGFSNAFINEQLKCVPGKTQNSFFTPGLGSGQPFYSTTDGWTTKSTVPNFTEVLTFGFGATFGGHTYPSIYAVGTYNGVYGIFMCKDWDGAQTWTQIGESYPKGILSTPSDIDGDKVTPGKVYMMTKAGGAFWGQFS